MTPAYYRERVRSDINEYLPVRPSIEKEPIKFIRNLQLPGSAAVGYWQLKSEPYRVWYDVDEFEKLVVIRAVVLKPPGKTTEEILWSLLASEK